MNCQECGLKLEDSAKFCKNCRTRCKVTSGINVRNSNSNRTRINSEASNKLTSIAKFFLLVMFVIIGFAASSFIMGNPREPDSQMPHDNEPHVVVLQSNLPYEIIGFGRYDAIFYYGSGRFGVYREVRYEVFGFGIYDINGNEVIPFGMYYHDRLSLIPSVGFVQRDGRYISVFDFSGNQIASFDGYHNVEMVTNNKFIVETYSNGDIRTGVVDARNQAIIPIGTYTYIQAVQDGRWFLVWEDSFKGLVDASGAEVIRVGRYRNIEPAGNDRFIVREEWPNHGVAVLQAAGTSTNEIIPLGRYDEIAQAGPNYFRVLGRGGFGIYDSSGAVVIPTNYSFIEYGGGFFIVRDESFLLGVYNSAGNKVIPFGLFDDIRFAGEGYFIVRVEDGGDMLFGIANSRGEVVLPFGINDTIWPIHGNRFLISCGANALIFSLNDNGFLVSSDTLDDPRYALFDSSGKEIIPTGSFDSIRPLHWGMLSFGVFRHSSIVSVGTDFGIDFDCGFIVSSGNLIGVVRLDGYEIIPIGRYAEVHRIHNGIAVVRNHQGQVGAINTRRIE